MIAKREALISLAAILAVVAVPARADTLYGALAQAYRDNPQLNVQRAQVRATDENVPLALSGYRPKVSGVTSIGAQSVSTTSSLLVPLGSPAQYWTQSGHDTPHSAGIQATQTLFDGFQTANRTRQAEAQVSGARATLSNTAEQILLSAATAYMNLLRDAALVQLNRRNVEVLEEGLRNTREQFKVGDVTETDIAQSESRLSGARAQLLIAESNYAGSVATYRQVIGTQPGKLEPGSPVDRFIPKTLNEAVAQGLAVHPSIVAAQFSVDIAISQLKVAEGALAPQLSMQLSVQDGWEQSLSLFNSSSASAIAQMTIPLYQGGAEYATIRQAKENLGQQRTALDLARDQVRQLIIQSWAQLKSTQAAIPETEAEVSAAERALNGVRQEARVGQRTTLDILNAQQELVNARASLVVAQRDRVVASYTLLSATGRLSPDVLGLPVADYNPAVHYHQVRDAWAGTRTPDGR